MTMVWTPCYFWLAPMPPLPNNAVTLLTTSTLSTSSSQMCFFLLLFSPLALSQFVLLNQVRIEVEFHFFFFYAGNESLIAQLTWEI